MSKKGPLAKVWLAAHYERKLSKAQTLQTDIGQSASGSRSICGEVGMLNWFATMNRGYRGPPDGTQNQWTALAWCLSDLQPQSEVFIG